MATIKKRDLYKYSPEKEIHTYLNNYVYEDISYVIIDYIMYSRGRYIKSLDLKEVGHKMCVYQDKIYVLNKSKPNNIFIFDSMTGILSMTYEVDIVCKDLLVNSKYIFLQQDKSSLQIYGRQYYKKYGKISIVIESVFVNEKEIYIFSNNNVVYVYSCDDFGVKKTYSFGMETNYLCSIEIFKKIIFADGDSVYFSDGFHNEFVHIYDKQTIKWKGCFKFGVSISRHNDYLPLCVPYKVKMDNYCVYPAYPYTLYNNYFVNSSQSVIRVYDMKTREKLKSVDLTKIIKFYNKKTKIIGIELTNDKLYIFDDNMKVHIFK